MKLTRALLLSSQKQAEAWEYDRTWIFATPRYRYLVTESPESENPFFLQIYRVSQGEYIDDKSAIHRKRNVVAEEAHVNVAFGDAEDLIAFLRTQEIDTATIWEPVEGQS